MSRYKYHHRRVHVVSMNTTESHLTLGEKGKGEQSLSNSCEEDSRLSIDLDFMLTLNVSYAGL